MKADGPWCPIIIRMQHGENKVFTTRAETVARPAMREVDYEVSTDVHSPWFHQLYIETCYVQIRRH